MNANETPDLKQVFNRVTNIGKFMVLSLFIMAGLIEITRILGFSYAAPGGRVLPYNAIGIVTPLMAIVVFTLLKIIRQNFSTSSVEKLSMTSLMMLTLCGLLVFPGLSFYFATGNTSCFYIGIALSLAMFYLYFPRMEMWEEWIRRDKTTQNNTGMFSLIVKESGNKWIYLSNPAVRILAVIVSVAFLTASFTMFKAERALIMELSTMFMGLVFILLATYKGAIEIDRSEGTVNKWRQIMGYRKNKIMQLSDFETVKVKTQTGSQNGPFYVMFLRGPSSSLNIYTNKYHDEAIKNARELADFLNLKFEKKMPSDHSKKKEKSIFA